MAKERIVPTQIIGRIESVEIPVLAPGKPLGRSPVAVLIRTKSGSGSESEWYGVAKEYRQRLYDLATTQALPIGKTCAIMLTETGAVVGFTVVPSRSS